MPKDELKTLCLYQDHMHLGFAYLEGNDLADFGIKSIRERPIENRLDHAKEIVSRLIRAKNPDHIVWMKRTSIGQPNNAKLPSITSLIKKLGSRQGAYLKQYSQQEVRKEICGNSKATRYKLIQYVLLYFPQLNMHIANDDALTLTYHIKVFNAVAVGMTFLRQQLGTALSINPQWHPPKATDDS